MFVRDQNTPLDDTQLNMSLDKTNSSLQYQKYMSLRLKFCLHYCEKLMGNIGRRLPCGNELTYKNGEIWSLVNLLAMQPEKI